MNAPREGSGTCAVLFTDLVDSTARRARLGEEAADRWSIEAERRARDLVRARRGWVVKGTGDGVLLHRAPRPGGARTRYLTPPHDTLERSTTWQTRRRAPLS
jgi:class 3 adenylate cyclase